jgi:hypothetical protein
MLLDCTCEHCGKAFRAYRTSMKRGGGPHRFCSRECRYAPRKAVPQADGSFLIPLHNNKATVVDAEDAHLSQIGKWTAQEDRPGKWYARRVIDGKTVSIHRLILDCPEDVDHIDGDGLNNRRGNLRCVTRSQNNMNSGRFRNNTSGFRGVCWHKQNRQWLAYIGGRPHRFLGLYATTEEAARAFDAAAREMYGDVARLNFPD